MKTLTIKKAGLSDSDFKAFIKELSENDKSRINKGELTPLQYAIEQGNEMLVTKLLELGADLEAPNKDGETPLHLADEFGYTEIFTKLLERGANLEAPNKDGNSPLYFATFMNYLDVVKELLYNGANPKIINKDGNTALDFVPTQYHSKQLTELLQVLKEYDGPNIKNENGFSLLHLAAAKGDSNKVSKLLERGATNPNIAYEDGYYTPLHYAATFGHSNVVSELLKRDANPNITDQDGYIPLHYAATEGHTEVFKALLGYIPNIKILKEIEEKLNNQAIKKELDVYQENPKAYLKERHKDNPGLLNKLYEKFDRNPSNYSLKLLKAKFKFLKPSEQEKLSEAVNKLIQSVDNSKAESTKVVDSKINNIQNNPRKRKSSEINSNFT